jgi:hypothetical protein
MCLEELGEVEAEKKIAREVIKQALKAHPRQPATRQRERPPSPSLTGRTPSGTPPRETVVESQLDSSQNLFPVSLPAPVPSTRAAPERVAPSPARGSVTPRGSVSRSQSLPPAPPPAHQSLSATPTRLLHHEATPDRRRKEAMLKVKGTPVRHPMSRWSQDRSGS